MESVRYNGCHRNRCYRYRRLLGGAQTTMKHALLLGVAVIVAILLAGIVVKYLPMKGA